MNELKEFITFVLSEGFQSHTFEPIVGDLVANDNPGCKHRGSVGTVLSVQDLPDEMGKSATYQCVNSGNSWSEGDILTKTLDQLVPAVSEEFAHHIQNNIPIHESLYKSNSIIFSRLIDEYKTLIARGAYKPTVIEACYIFGMPINDYNEASGGKKMKMTESRLRRIIRSLTQKSLFEAKPFRMPDSYYDPPDEEEIPDEIYDDLDDIFERAASSPNKEHAFSGPNGDYTLIDETEAGGDILPAYILIDPSGGEEQFDVERKDEIEKLEDIIMNILLKNHAQQKADLDAEYAENRY